MIVGPTLASLQEWPRLLIRGGLSMLVLNRPLRITSTRPMGCLDPWTVVSRALRF